MPTDSSACLASRLPPTAAPAVTSTAVSRSSQKNGALYRHQKTGIQVATPLSHTPQAQAFHRNALQCHHPLTPPITSTGTTPTPTKTTKTSYVSRTTSATPTMQPRGHWPTSPTLPGCSQHDSSHATASHASNTAQQHLPSHQHVHTCFPVSTSTPRHMPTQSATKGQYNVSTSSCLLHSQTTGPWPHPASTHIRNLAQTPMVRIHAPGELEVMQPAQPTDTIFFGQCIWQASLLYPSPPLPPPSKMVLELTSTRTC